MSKEEENIIKGQALLRLNTAQQRVACHRKKIENISESLAAAAKALLAPDLRIVNVNNKDLLTSEGILAEYPSLEQVVAAVNEYKEATKERASALDACHRLNLSSL